MALNLPATESAPIPVVPPRTQECRSLGTEAEEGRVLSFANLILTNELAALTVPEVCRDRGLPTVSPNLYSVWMLRKDLQERFALDTEAGYVGFVVWGATFGRKDYFSLLQEFEANRPVFDAPYTAFTPEIAITNFMYMVCLANPRATETFDLNSQRGKQEFLRWYLGKYIFQTPAIELLSPVLAGQLFLPAPADQGAARGLTYFLRAWLALRPDLQQAFDVRTPEGLAGLVTWYWQHGRHELDQPEWFVNAHMAAIAKAVKAPEPVPIAKPLNAPEPAAE